MLSRHDKLNGVNFLEEGIKKNLQKLSAELGMHLRFRAMTN